MKNTLLIMGAALLPALSVQAGEAGTTPFTLSGYAEAYYLFDEQQTSHSRRPAFVYSHNRSNEAALNLALLKASYDSERVRSTIGIAGGSYMQANYAAEPGVLQHVFEARAGVKLSREQDVWLDVGVLPSHIGFESAIGANNWTLTRSLLADNSPYFETGAQLSYTSANGRWYAAALLLNGWQRIQRPDGNTTPAIGHQLTYKPSTRITLNSSSFIGNDKSDRARQLRYFHNFYGQFQLDEAWSLTAGLDVGAQQRAHGSSAYDDWFAPVLIARYAPPGKLSWAARAEYYRDQDGVIVAANSPDGFAMRGYSLNLDYALAPGMSWRTELRHLRGRGDDFLTTDATTAADSFIATTAVTFTF